ncbi:unnamed protein product [Paramecium sonneborni]|uniref:Uncharacterized protein n=1 Tax=Paramecium sonneborni TaxID=65129 RepID=A0A8S1QY00_9CILI|nr:unnamed protein product [Paramecium sonneborni]
MNSTYQNKISSNLTPRKQKQNDKQSLLQLQDQINFNRTISKCLENSTNNKKRDSFLSMLIQEQQQAITTRQLSVNKSVKTSPIESSPYLQKSTATTSFSHSLIRKSVEQSQKITTQFDKLLYENSSLLMRIQELEQKNSLLQMKCQSSRIQNFVFKQVKQKSDINQILQANKNNENENRILRELINRQTSLMHIPSVLQTLSLKK